MIGTEPTGGDAVAMPEYRRILLEGAVTPVTVEADELVAGDGRRVAADEAVHLPPSEPSKILCVHLNHISRVQEFQTSLPPAPTYFHKPVSALNGHHGEVVRPDRCRWLNYEGEIVVIGRPCRNVAPTDAGAYIAGYSIGNDYGLHRLPRDTRRRVDAAGQGLGHAGSGSVPAWSPTGTSTTRRSAPWSTARSARTARPAR